ncbi:helix-turn-helix domain-containing protein [Burkholderia cepacia]|uniref:helix-turn-helix domain-containing protein n=1 Tax=Burkholderia TaxID=32008 RepID=UPI0018673107|nr:MULTISPECIES: helix-turn-helix domain-containing protein [Burkholderia]MBE2966666.1 helix-turn-helix domain-containing protein [Burkholderia cepacia]
MIHTVHSPTVVDANTVSAREPTTRGGRLLRLYNLRLPFPIHLSARRGHHLLAGERRRGVLTQGRSAVLAPYRTVHYEGAVAIDPRTGYELHLTIDRHVEHVATDAWDTTATPVLAVRVARAVFSDPASAWSVPFTAERLQMSPRTLTGQLFRENNALTAIVREQRLMRALLALLAYPQTRDDLRALAVQLGFASAARLNDTFDEHFGSTATRIATLAWYPALTWSFAGRPCSRDSLG